MVITMKEMPKQLYVYSLDGRSSSTTQSQHAWNTHHHHIPFYRARASASLTLLSSRSLSFLFLFGVFALSLKVTIHHDFFYSCNMHNYLGAASLLGAIGIANAATHELIVGTFGTPFLYTIEFNDETLTLQQTANTSVPIASSWLSLNVSCNVT